MNEEKQERASSPAPVPDSAKGSGDTGQCDSSAAVVGKSDPGQRITDLETLLRRLQADFDNFRKQTEKEKTDMQAHGNAALLRNLLPLLDEFEHSLHEAKKHHAAKEVVHGFHMVHSNLLRLLRSEGIKEMNAQNESFDPYRHEALRQEESELPEGRVVSVVRKGYYYRDRVLRPAAVIVSKGKAQGIEKGETHG